MKALRLGLVLLGAGCSVPGIGNGIAACDSTDSCPAPYFCVLDDGASGHCYLPDSGLTSGTTGTTATGRTSSGSSGTGATGSSSGSATGTSGSTSSGGTRTLRNWAACDGISDDAPAVASAFAAAADGGFTLLVDCPARIHIGTDITRPIFVDNGTTVQFATDGGLFIVDDVELPAFVLANTTDVTFTGWQVEWTGSLPVAQDAGGYVVDGGFVAQAGGLQPIYNFNNQTLTPWLSRHRELIFDAGAEYLPDSGWVELSAIFAFIGSTSMVNVSGMNVYVPQSAGGSEFIPCVFGIAPGFLDNQTVIAGMPFTAEHFAVPGSLSFTDITLNGTYIGWESSGVQGLAISNVQSLRYGDLQDVDGGQIGGDTKWFPPPHLMFLSYDATGDSALFNQNIQIKNVMDEGPRIGAARDVNPAQLGGIDGGYCLDAGATCELSGFASSLKIGGVDSSVDHYSSARPDGLMDLLPSSNLAFTNVTGTYDSSFLNDLFPGVRWPTGPYQGVSFQNVSVTDMATSPVQLPMTGTGAGTSLQISGTTLILRQQPTDGLVPYFEGQGNNIQLEYDILGPPAVVEAAVLGTLAWQLEASPSTLQSGNDTVLTWSAVNATSCAASGAWSGVQALSGMASEPVVADAGFTLTCTGDGGTGAVTVDVVAQ